MKIQYISCHQVLEYDEVRLLAQLGFDIKSNGAYRDPRGAYTLSRPGIAEIPFDQEFFDLTGLHPKTALPPELIEPFDVIIIMSGLNEQILVQNWEKMKHKRVIWRSIGQNTPATEKMLQKYRAEGLEIVRYSPNERNYDNFAGEDALIRFPKDTAIYKQDWIGDDVRPVNFTQSLQSRGRFAHYDEIMGTLAGYNGLVYGPGNDDLGVFNGGDLPFDRMLEVLRHARAYVYGGTWPAPYTLSFIEALMIGIPIVAIDDALAHISNVEKFDFYEVAHILSMADVAAYKNVGEMRGMVGSHLNNLEYAQAQSKRQQNLARELFSYETIGPQWQAYLTGGNHAN